jgi:hypothetical protein
MGRNEDLRVAVFNNSTDKPFSIKVDWRISNGVVGTITHIIGKILTGDLFEGAMVML